MPPDAQELRMPIVLPGGALEGDGSLRRLRQT